MRANGIIIAIDGPAGSGKSTVACKVAGLLGYLYVDTGAMYRALTLKALRMRMPIDDSYMLSTLAEGADIKELKRNDGCLSVWLDGEDVSDAIRSPDVSGSVSAVSAIPGVRQAMVKKQQAIGSVGGVVMEGRDIQTVVFPDAELKVFLVASAEERARRRWLELTEQGYDVSFDDVFAQTKERDRADSTREASPLTKAPDAIEVDSTGLSADEVGAHIVALAN